MKKEKIILEKFSKEGLDDLTSSLENIGDSGDKFKINITLTNMTSKRRTILGLCNCKDASGVKKWQDCNNCV